MKNTASRTVFVLILAFILLFGVLTFFIRYFFYADKWFSFDGNPHVYLAKKEEGAENGQTVVYPDIGKVVDRGGTLLYSTEDGLHYAEDELTRRATLHLLGDKYKVIPPVILNKYASELIGYDKISGVWSSNQGTGELTLSLDAQVQDVALQALDGRRGVVGVYNYKTGEILCAVTSPTYDPENAPSYEEVQENADGAYDGVYVYRFFNTAYTPGSIFKLVTCAAALESVPGIAEERFVCEGSITVNGEVIRCENGKKHGEQSLKEALANSCNCAFAQIAKKVGREALTAKAAQIGIGESLYVDGFATVPGSFRAADADDNGFAWAAIGQYTDLINPCQYMVYMGAIANRGRAALPYLVSRVDRVRGDSRSTAYLSETSWSEPMITAAAADVLADMMANNVTEKYGELRFPGIRICAKSGTAEVGGSAGGEQAGRKASTATFAGFVDDARYPLAFLVVVEEGGAGSRTCAPIVQKVLTACFNALGE